MIGIAIQEASQLPFAKSYQSDVVAKLRPVSGRGLQLEKEFWLFDELGVEVEGKFLVGSSWRVEAWGKVGVGPRRGGSWVWR